jgi:ribosomal protein S18 acetylase RimI-like enzyme
MASLAFRFATIDDVPAVVVLVESAYRGDASRAGWTTEADLLEGQRTDAAMVAEAIGRDGVQVLLAERDGELVACCELTAPGGERDPQATGAFAAAQSGSGAEPPHGCSAESRTAGSAYLGMFAVQPELQGAGIGRAVLDEAARIAGDDWGAEALELSTLHPREELIAWYERCGFARTGELRAFPYGDERYGVPQRDDIQQVVLSRPLR